MLNKENIIDPIHKPSIREESSSSNSSKLSSPRSKSVKTSKSVKRRNTRFDE
jgi:hypothetical protein